MQVKKLLLVPIYKLLARDKSVSQRIRERVEEMLGRRKKRIYSNELLFHGDMPRVLGFDSVFVLGRRYHAHLHDRFVREDCATPACHGTPQHRFVDELEAASLMRNDIDAVLISAWAGQAGERAIREARRNDLPIAIVDCVDHESNYSAIDKRKELCRQFQRREHFDLYFKKDLPVGYATDVIRPLAPVPVRPDVYRFERVPKEVDIFYSGRPRVEKVQADRPETVELVRKHFRNVFINEHEGAKGFMTTKEYWWNLARCRMALSPSGRVWDNFRNTETGLAPHTVLIAPVPYVETTGPALVDGKNSILYQTEFRDGRYHLKNTDELREKIAYWLDRPEGCASVADAWSQDVSQGHTIFARSRYIIEEMERRL